MSRTRNQLWPLVLPIVCGISANLYSGWIASHSVDSSWTDLMEAWNPNDPSSTYSLSLPSPQPLEVTLIKNAGGNHNRYWEIHIDSAFEPSPSRSSAGDPPLAGKAGLSAGTSRLTQREFLGSNSEFFGDARPGIWYRRKANTWQFLTYQDINAPGPGPEIVPRANFKPGLEDRLVEGYFTWQLGSKWLACDRHGNTAP